MSLTYDELRDLLCALTSATSASRPTSAVTGDGIDGGRPPRVRAAEPLGEHGRQVTSYELPQRPLHR